MKNNKILIIEDDFQIIKAYLAGLQHRGYEVIYATDGAMGVEKTIREYPDVILLDLRLPIKNGFEVLEIIKGREASKHIPVIVLSNDDRPCSFEKTIKKGANNYLLKAHLSMDEISEEIAKQLRIC